MVVKGEWRSVGSAIFLFYAKKRLPAGKFPRTGSRFWVLILETMMRRVQFWFSPENRGRSLGLERRDIERGAIALRKKSKQKYLGHLH